jgi:hypothetical protein
MLNRNLNLQRYKVLFVTGNYSGILSRLHRRFMGLEIRRGFTTFLLITILEEACRSLIIGNGRVHFSGIEASCSLGTEIHVQILAEKEQFGLKNHAEYWN